MIAKVRALLSTQYALMLEYRVELLLWALAGSLPFILLGVWSEAAQNASLAMTPEQLGRYFVSVFLVRQLCAVWVIWEVEYDIVHGAFSSYLLQPFEPVWRYVAAHLAERVARAPLLLLLLGVFFLVYPEARFVPALTDGLAFAAVIPLAFATRFALQWAMAQLCFWTERASSAESVFALALLFGSGLLAPLELYPEPLRDALLWTPLPWLVHFPAQVLSGQAQALGTGFAVLAGWTMVGATAATLASKAGRRRFSAMGA